MSEHRVGIIGLGYQLPAKVRGNDDPIFTWLREHSPPGKDLFTGVMTRHVLDEGERVIDILVPAALRALAEAGVAPSEIDHVIGSVSPGPYIIPDGLFELSGRLQLGELVSTIPINNDFSNFNVSVQIADALVRSGRARCVLVAVGGGWSRAVSYTTPWAGTVGDAAVAAVVGSRRHGEPIWTVIDAEVVSRELKFGEMGLYPSPLPSSTTVPAGLPVDDQTLQRASGPWFQITNDGLKDFGAFGGETAPTAALRLIARQGLGPQTVTVTGHQVSDALFVKWRELLAPVQVFETLRDFGNMTVANIPFNLCKLTENTPTPYVILLSLAPDMHANALLLKRHA